MERTLTLLKPDAVQRGLIGAIIARFEHKGLRLAAVKMLAIEEERARQLYAMHVEKDFYEPLVRFITSGPVVAMVWAGKEAIAVCRSLMGATFGPDAAPGTVRGDFGLSRRHNLVHGSDSAESARREIDLFFAAEEICSYELASANWVYAAGDGERI